MKSSRSKLTTFLLALFLGVFGAHRLYSGHVLLAILYFFTGGGFLIGVVVDLILLILGQYTDVEGKVI